MAHRLGLHGVQRELEDLALQVLRPPAGVPRLAWTLQRPRSGQAPSWTVSLAGIARTPGITGAVVALTAPGPIAVWVLAGVGLAALGLLGALLFARDDAPSRRLADLVRAWRGYRATRTRYPQD